MFYLLTVKPAEEIKGSKVHGHVFEFPNDEQAIKLSEKIASKTKFRMPGEGTCASLPVKLESLGEHHLEQSVRIIKQW